MNHLRAKCTPSLRSTLSAHRLRARRAAATAVYVSTLKLGVLLLATGCVSTGIPPIGGTPAQQLGESESLFRDARDLYFQVYVLDATGAERSARGFDLASLKRSYDVLRERAQESVNALDSTRFGAQDQRAIRAMRSNLPRWVAEEPAATVDCGYTPAQLVAGEGGLAQLSARMYTCYGSAASRVVTPRDTADRLTILSRLASDSSSGRRRALFMSLAPVWRTVNGDNAPTSPYRTMVPLSAARWLRDGSPVDAAARSLGLDPASVDSTLVRMLRAWRDRIPPARLEPWDWYYANGAAGRALSARLTLAALSEVNERYFAAMGASPRSLGIRYDLAPRVGKTPVAFTQFGGLPRRGRNGPSGAAPQVVATYREGSFGNLVELLHETGHAIHIAAINTRPAFADWPDSDPLTEGLADVAALEAYEPAWQLKYLGDSVSRSESTREKYSGVMLDIAWALFELRMHAAPWRDPNALWAELTSEYLRIVPHPELSWWAMRGQLIDAPGYMMNYALGAMIAASVRARIVEQLGGLTAANNRTYDWLSSRLYVFGQGRASREVLQEFLGVGLGAEALIRDVGAGAR